MNANIVFVSLFALYLWGCGDDSPTASKATLDTAPRTDSLTYVIQEWNGSEWINSIHSVSVESSWRFVSSVEEDRGLSVSGGYTLTLTNPTDRVVLYRIGKLKFYDSSDIAIAEYDVIPQDEFNIEPSGKFTRTGTFNITVANLEVTELITRMGLTASCGFKL
jgi:hypothetical protein